MRVGYFLSSDEFDPLSLLERPALMRPRPRRHTQAIERYVEALRLLRGRRSVAQLVSGEAHRPISILGTTMKDQQLIGGK